MSIVEVGKRFAMTLKNLSESATWIFTSGMVVRDVVELDVDKLCPSTAMVDRDSVKTG